MAMVAGPLLCLLVLEFGLRLAGFGYPTGFLLPAVGDSQKYWEQNNKFGWRFFGKQMSRAPAPIWIPQSKPANTIRIFVFGESAAYGDPQPEFGLPRMIEAMLSLRHPGKRFEVVNAAMTGINSHTIVPIARDCAKAGGDVWVVYMGNNEVVGPFGAGTVFGPQEPPLSLIRATIALKSTRAGQVLDLARQSLQKAPPDKSEWGGMLMFMDQQVRADDPRMKSVYDHFERNLTDIVRMGNRSGAAIVVSTVPVNLRDCAPFASSFSPAISESQRALWDAAYKRGVQAQESGRNQDAAENFHEAERIDGTVADLRFREAFCAAALGQSAEAVQHFRAARDLDTLRFRCDSRLNEITRGVARKPGSDRVFLVDAERAFSDLSSAGVPGSEWFYEHVHLTFEGNYQLARLLLPQIEKALRGKLEESTGVGVPGIEDCARRLAWSNRGRVAALGEILTRLSDPPFTHQLNHEVQLEQLRQLIKKASGGDPGALLKQDLDQCVSALAIAPADPYLHAELASIKLDMEDPDGALPAAQKAVELLPSSGEFWAELGAVLVKLTNYAEAATAFSRAVELNPEDVWSQNNLAQALVKLGRRDEAERTYREAVATKPRFGIAWLGLGLLLEEDGKQEEAKECFQKAVENRIHRAPELTALARFCQSRGWVEAAATNYLDAVKLSPADASLRLEAGRALAAAGKNSDAAIQYQEAARLAPGLVQARYLYGLELGREGRHAEAVEEFRAAVRLMPELVEARLNLGMALINAGREGEALSEFERVLERDPTNAFARAKISELRAKQESN